jgi:hypothetical protein
MESLKSRDEEIVTKTFEFVMVMKAPVCDA